MSKKLTFKELSFEERKKVAQEIVDNSNLDDDDVFGEPKKQRKSLKTPSEKLVRYQCIVSDSVFWASRQAYLELVQSFLSKKIDGSTFDDKFSRLRTKDMIRTDELSAILEDRIRPIPDLYYTFKADDFGSAIDDLYLEIDRYDPNIDDWYWDEAEIVFSENQLRSVIQKKFVPAFQHSCDLNDSFFRPQVDFDQLIRRSYLIFIISSLGLLTSLITNYL